jgi:hypothetical protein
MAVGHGPSYSQRDRVIDAAFGRAAGVPKDSIRRLLNHSGGDVTDHYMRDTGLGRLHAAEQETISAAIVRAMGSPWGLM